MGDNTPTAPTAATPAPDPGPRTVGPYRLLEPLGEGGMGVVYLAEQTEPVRRRVALKLIKPGMDSKRVIARFEAERQALALMDHPNVARVLDAGTTDAGLPYFVMELVRGTPITEFCDRHRLSIDDRITLFIDVCNAVQHAHHKGVIHRDLKPSNILVEHAEGRSIPKVIDFGVAKALNQQLTDATLFTAEGQLIGTPEYMSPEQAERSAEDVDTRADVYSLGVVLYELLTGALPFDRETLRAAGIAEVHRIIREVDPPKPSTRLSQSKGSLEVVVQSRHTDAAQLQRALRTDLDWLVMACLDKDRARRYQTASSLADELGRFLSRQPLTAGPPSVTYRLRKFANRHRGPVFGGVAFAIMLIAGITGMSLALDLAKARKHKLEQALVQAELHLRDARLVNAHLELLAQGSFALSAQDQDVGHNLRTIEELLQRYDQLGASDSLGAAIAHLLWALVENLREAPEFAKVATSAAAAARIAQPLRSTNPATTTSRDGLLEDHGLTLIGRPFTSSTVAIVAMELQIRAALELERPEHASELAASYLELLEADACGLRVKQHVGLLFGGPVASIESITYRLRSSGMSHHAESILVVAIRCFSDDLYSAGMSPNSLLSATVACRHDLGDHDEAVMLREINRLLHETPADLELRATSTWQHDALSMLERGVGGSFDRTAIGSSP